MPAIEPPIAWTLFRAAQEFGCHRDTLKKRLNTTGANPAEDGSYTTAQICAALFGDKEADRRREQRAVADMAEMDRDERASALLPAGMVAEVWQDALAQLRAVINGLELPLANKRKLLETLREIPLSEYSPKVETDATASEE